MPDTPVINPSPGAGFPPVVLPAKTSGLHPVARQLLVALRAADPDPAGRVRVEQLTAVPAVLVTQGQIAAAARACDAIIRALAARGVPFKPARRSWQSGYFESQRQRVHLQIEEPIETVAVAVTAAMKRRPSWDWPRTVQKPAGQLVVSIRAEPACQPPFNAAWKEANLGSLAAVVEAVVGGIWQFYCEREARQLAETKREQEQQQRWESEREQLNQRQQAEKREALEQKRKAALCAAAEAWRSQRLLEDFIGACEERWQTAQGALTPEQTGWIAWARQVASGLSPFAAGYPDPVRDAWVGLTGSTTATDSHPGNLPRFPPLPEMPAPAAAPGPTGPPVQTQPYPFWLRHQRH
jgi:hypothetical protein